MPATGDASPFVNNVFAGWVAGAGQVLIGQPFDAVKVRLQTTQAYTDSLHCLRDITRKESLFVLYRGSSSPLLGIGLISAVQFSAREHFSSYGPFYSGCLSGIIGSVLICPFEAVRIRMQLHEQNHSLLATAVRTGVAGCYRGFLSVLVRESVGMGVYFWTFERGIKWVRNSEYSPLAAGGLAGIAYWASIYPVDVVKTCIQSCSSPSFCSYRSIVGHLWKSNGFFRGFWPCLLRAVPVNAVAFFLYHHTHKWLGGVD